MLALLPASKSLEKLNLGLNRIGGCIPAGTDMIEFTVLSEIELYDMELSGRQTKIRARLESPELFTVHNSVFAFHSQA